MEVKNQYNQVKNYSNIIIVFIDDLNEERAVKKKEERLEIIIELQLLL
jgi:hypothetical protein